MDSSRPKMGALGAIAFCLFALSFQNANGATAEVAIPKVIAVQDRTYFLNKELDFQLGYMPLDSFNKYVTFGGGYTHYFSDFLAWEVVDAEYCGDVPTSLAQTLIDKLQQQPMPEQIDPISYFGTTNVIFTPFYSKNLIFDQNIVHGDISFAAGAGVAKFVQAGIVPTVDVGLILRYSLGRTLALKLNFREYFYFGQGTKNDMLMGAGLAWNFGTQDPKEIKAED